MYALSGRIFLYVKRGGTAAALLIIAPVPAFLSGAGAFYFALLPYIF